MRGDLITIARTRGWEPGKVPDPSQRELIGQDLRSALENADLAPTRVFGIDGTFRPMTLDEAVENLIEELV